MKHGNIKTTLFLFFLGVSILIIAITGCDNCKNTDPIILLASKNLKAIGVFKPGTYWIYQNDSTFLLDSVAVSKCLHDSIPVTAPCGRNNSNLTIVSYRENFYTYLNSFTFNKNYLLKVEINQPVLFFRDSLPADTIFIDAPCSDTGFCRIIDTLQILKLPPSINTGYYLYRNVYERIDSSSLSENGDLVYYYSASYYGIVKKQIVHPDHFIESWSLIRFHIIQ